MLALFRKATGSIGNPGSQCCIGIVRSLAIGQSFTQRTPDAPNIHESQPPSSTAPSWDSLLQSPRPPSIIASAQRSTELTSEHHGQYYPLDEASIPEAFDPWYTNRVMPARKNVPVDGGGAVRPLPKFIAGCAGLQHEFALSRYPYVMHRAPYGPLWDVLEAPKEAAHRRVLVRGAPGSGKSVLLAATAERLRKQGWIVMYIPDCQDVTHRNIAFSKNEDTGMFDTRDAAQNILRAVAEAHSEQLRELPQMLEGGSGCLLDLCKLPESASDASFCAAVVRLKLELYHLPTSQPSAVILDNYNSLFWRSELFHATSLSSPLHRIDAQELTLSANLRVLSDAATGETAVIAAVSTSGEVPSLPLDLPPGGDVEYTKYTLPLLQEDELGTMLLFYRHVHALAPHQAVSRRGVQAAHQLTQGDGKAVRKHLHFLLPYDPALDNMDAIGEQYAGVSLKPE